MDFSLSEEQLAIKTMLGKFLNKKSPREWVQKWDEQGEFPEALFASISEMGLCGLLISETYGGSGQDFFGAALVAEELAAINPVVAGAYTISALVGAQIISELGSEEQKKKILPGLAAGSLFLTCGLTESETKNIGISAAKEEDGYSLNGNVQNVWLARGADLALVLARMETESETQNNLAFFLIDLKSPGVEVREKPQVGCRGLGLGELEFKQFKVPADNILGGMTKINLESRDVNKVRAYYHLGVAACCVGIAQGASEYAFRYAEERIQFGHSIIEFGAVSRMFVEMAIKIRAARFLTYQSCCLAGQSGFRASEAAAARVYAGETVKNVTLQSLQILGGYGYTMEYDAQRYVRDSLVMANDGLLEFNRDDIEEILC